MSPTVLQHSFRVVCEVELLDADGNPLGHIPQILPGGQVTLDTTAEVMGTCAFQCLDPSGALTPQDNGSGLLYPNGVQVAISVGWIDSSDKTETAVLWPCGVFEVVEVDVATGVGSVPVGPILNVSGSDRSQRISEELFEDSFNIAAGQTIPEAVSAILSHQAPWVKATNFAPTDFEIAAQTYQPGDDPWQAMQNIALAGGQVLYFDAKGVLVTRVDPSSSGAGPVLGITDGAKGIAADVTSTISNSPGYNGVIVNGSSLTNDPVAGSAFDMNPSSPLYALGPYGFRPAPPVDVSTATTPAQCDAIAQVLLPQVLGLSRSVTIDMLPVPFVYAYDLIAVANSQVKVKGTQIASHLTIPMDSTQLEVVTAVPLGTPLAMIDGLNDTPSVAQFAPTTPLGNNFSFDPFTGEFTFDGGEFGAGGIFGGGGLFGGLPGNPFNNGPLELFSGTGLFSGLNNVSPIHWVRRILGSGLTDAEDDA